MVGVIKAEIRKNFRIGTIIVWIFTIFMSCFAINGIGLQESYSDIFFKYFGMAPLMGLIMFMMFSGSFILEYNSNMDGLIKATKNGKKQLVISKFIACGISASIVNLSILYSMALKVFVPFKFKGLNIPLKDLWYFGNSGSNITVIQLLVIMTVTIMIGSFLLASIGLWLSSISKNAIIPFLLGGAFMAIPYFMEARNIVRNIILIPMFGMYSSLLIRYKLPTYWVVAFIIISIIGSVSCYVMAKKSFLKER